ncbi:MAG: type II toxin-antitoxin system VapC family toxin [Candidatus Sumerlaeota bacterium]|nr:type II toxin-antitoxin system VapC family toxin [Candidatus Sumerlaeota bacterium]
MIVVDTNLLAYFFLGGTGTAPARDVFLRDPEWAAPMLWRSEFRSVLIQYVRQGHLDVEQAILAYKMAQRLLAGREFVPDPAAVIRLAAASGCTAYDSEFVAVARQLRATLVTSDKAILAAFPNTAIAPARWLKTGAP